MNAAELDEREVIDAITSKVIACAHRVSNALGAGFLEKVYENAMAVELRHQGFNFSQQAGIHVRYRQEVVGEYIPDLIVEDRVVVEVKAIDLLTRIHQAQCLNYLRATGLSVALLMNFGRPHLETKRIVLHF